MDKEFYIRIIRTIITQGRMHREVPFSNERTGAMGQTEYVYT